MKKVIFILSAAGIIILFAETALRMSGKYRTYSERINSIYVSPYAEESRNEYLFRYNPGTTVHQKGKEFLFQRRVNAIGFTEHRTPEIFLHGFSILALGDSYTEGMGAEYQESWPRRLEALLNTGDENYRVYNSGISGNDPFFEFQNLKFLFPKIQPRIVIILLNRSDFSDVVIRGGMERFQRDGSVRYQRKAPWWEPFYKWSHTARAVFHFPIFNIKGNNIFKEGTPGILGALDSCRTYTEEHHAILLPVYLPIPVKGKVVISPDEKIYLDSMKSRYGLLFLDLTSTIRAHADSRFFWELDSHCTNLGYDVIAQAILEHLQRNVLPRTSRTSVFKQ